MTKEDFIKRKADQLRDWFEEGFITFMDYVYLKNVLYIPVEED